VQWHFVILTPAPGLTVAPVPMEAGSLEALIPSQVKVYRRPSLIRIPAFLWNSLRLKHPPRVSSPTMSDGGNFVRRFLRLLKQIILIPDEDIIWSLLNFRFGIRLAYEYQVDLVYASIPPYSSAIMGYLIASSAKIPFVLDMKDDWAEYIQRQGKAKIVQKLEFRIESSILRRASSVVVPTKEGIRNILTRHPGLSSTNLALLPNGCDLSEFKANHTDLVSNKHADKFVVVCGVGGISRKYRDAQPFLTAVNELCQNDLQFKLHTRVRFYGSSVYEDYGEYIRTHSLESVIESYPTLSRPEYIRVLVCADVLLLVQMDDVPSSISGTLYEYWAAGGPPVFLIGGHGATKSFLVEHNLGFAFAVNQIEEIRNCLSDLYQAWKHGAVVRISPSTDIYQFDRRNLAHKLGEVFMKDIASWGSKCHI